MQQENLHNPANAPARTIAEESADSVASMEFRLFQNILDSMQAGIGIISKNYTLLYSNAFLNTLLDASTQAQTGDKIYINKGLPGTQLLEIKQHLDGNEYWQGVFPNLGRGLKVVISRMNVPIPASVAQLAGAHFMVTVTDHSDFLQKQQELTEAENLAIKSDKAKSEFLSHMSHELRTPLNAVLGFTQLLKVEPDLSEIQKDNVNEILTASNHLLKLINEILELSRLDDAKLSLFTETININDLFTECISLAEPLALKAGVQVNQLQTRVSLANDRVRLKQILLNILSNAIKYNHQGGQVVIQSFPIDKHNIRIEIQDSGKGISPELQDTIFKPFARLGEDGALNEGAGIGLMIARRLAQHMSGRVNVISAPESGSIFSLDFPTGSIFMNKELNDENSHLFENTRRVLWIGENSDTRRFANSLSGLRPALEFHHVSDIATANELCEKLNPDLIFIKVKSSLDSLVEPSPETKILLKKIPTIAVIDCITSSKEKIAGSLESTSYLTTPLQAIDFMKIIDRQLYQSINGIA